MVENMNILIGWMALPLAVVVLLAAGCAGPTPTQEVPQPFSARTESEDGAIVAWSGSTTRYEPGTEATFDLSIQNETGQPWQGRYCLLLLAGRSHQVIATLEQRPCTLQPGVGFSNSLTVRFPTDLAEGAYGLTLVVRRPDGPMVDLVPIQVGETDEVRGETTQQDMDAALAACPPVEGPPSGGAITVEGVTVTAEQVVVRGTSTLPDCTCVSAELWADGAPQDWWPVDACASVGEGAWELVIPLPSGQTLQPGVQYMVRAYQPGGPNVVSTFPFDLDGPPD